MVATDRVANARAAYEAAKAMPKETRLTRATRLEEAAAQLIAAQDARIRALEAGMVDCYLITLQLTVQSRISAAQPGSNISARILEALGADALRALVDAVPVERRRQLAEGDAALAAPPSHDAQEGTE